MAVRIPDFENRSQSRSKDSEIYRYLKIWWYLNICCRLEYQEQLDHVCKTTPVEKSDPVSNGGVANPASSSSNADDEMEHGQFRQTNAAKDLADLCSEMKSCLKLFVKHNQVSWKGGSYKSGNLGKGGWL